MVSGRLDLEMYLLIVGPTRSGKGTYIKALKAFLPPSAVTGFQRHSCATVSARSR